MDWQMAVMAGGEAPREEVAIIHEMIKNQIITDYQAAQLTMGSHKDRHNGNGRKNGKSHD